MRRQFVNNISLRHVRWITTKLQRLTFGSIIADHACNDTENHRTPGGAVSGCRGGSNKTGNGARAPTNHGPLSRQPPIENDPRGGSKHGRQVSVPASLHGSQICPERRPSVEPKPTEPKKDRTQYNQGYIVRTEIRHHLFLPFTQYERVCQSGHAGAYLDGPAPSVVLDPILETPAVDVPSPASDGTVHEGGPTENKNQHGKDTTSLSDGACRNGGCSGAEL